MEADDKAAFGLLLALLGETFEKSITPTLLKAYWIPLSDIPLADLEVATDAALRQCKFFPKPAELRELSGHGDGEDAAMRAFGVFLASMQRLGPYKHVDFQDRAINATIRNLGGWPTYIERFQNAEAEKFARLDFVKTYVRIGRGIIGEAGDPLAGINEAENGGPPRIRQIPCPYLAESPSKIAVNDDELTNPVVGLAGTLTSAAS